MTTNLVARYVTIAIVILLAVLCIVYNDISLGIDLRGGSVLTYKVEKLGQAETRTDLSEEIRQEEIQDTVAVISQRINKEGVKDIAVRQLGKGFIEITLPEATPAETEEINRKMTQVGELLMPVKAENGDEAYGVRFNEQQFNQRRKTDLDAGRTHVAPKGFRWFPTRPEKGPKESETAYKNRLETYENNLRKNISEVQGQWMYFDPAYWDADLVPEGFTAGFTGRDIYDVARGTDRNGGRAVNYRVKEGRQVEFQAYTKKHTGRLKALVLNEEIWSAATIQETLKDNVQISRGGGYTEDEQKWLVNCLQSGSLKLKPRLLSKEDIGATLGQLAVQRGQWAFILGGVVVILFMVFYYRLAGVFAVIALGLNFVMVFGIIMLLQASLTLPGIAGLVLTVGMAVDANILIFERIREELDKGKKLVHAAKNGFDRAFVTIFDANLTTFIVAAFLVAYGKGPIKGFGYTLMTGIVCSMFAGLYITRTLLGTGIARGWITDLKMMRLLGKTSINFAAMTKKAATLSVILVLAGVAIFVVTPSGTKYGLDFNGGTSVRMHFAEEVTAADVRGIVQDLKNDAGKQKYLDIAPTLVKRTDDTPESVKGIIDLKLDYQPAGSKAEGSDGEDEFQVIQDELLQAFAGKLVPSALADETYNVADGAWSATLNLAMPLDDQGQLIQAMNTAGIQQAAAVPQGGNSSWKISGKVQPERKNQVKADLFTAFAENEKIAESSPFPKVRFLGPQVVDDLKASAIKAMLVSLLFILAYIWFRFKELKYGVAAAVALVHDVLVALGLTVGMNAIGIIHVPISLNVIAAFLTIIGYSLNDTIVVFDRIRENLGNTKGTFGEVVNKSINQTLSRTVLTSLTTFFVIFAVFVANYGLESPLEGLGFTLLCGVVVGTYSSIFVASPMLVWLNGREERKTDTSGAKAKAKPVGA